MASCRFIPHFFGIIKVLFTYWTSRSCFICDDYRQISNWLQEANKVVLQKKPSLHREINEGGFSNLTPELDRVRWCRNRLTTDITDHDMMWGRHAGYNGIHFSKTYCSDKFISEAFQLGRTHVIFFIKIHNHCYYPARTVCSVYSELYVSRSHSVEPYRGLLYFNLSLFFVT